MSLRNHVWAVRVLAVGTLAWIVAQVGLGLWLGEWRYALAEAIGGLSWLALVVILPLRTSNALACPACGYSYGPRILRKMTCPHCGASVPDDVHTGWSMVVALVLVAVVGVGTAVYTWPMALPSLPRPAGGGSHCGGFRCHPTDGWGALCAHTRLSGSGGGSRDYVRLHLPPVLEDPAG